MTMIMYNVPLGWAAGAAAMLCALGAWRIYTGKARHIQVWAAIPAVFGVVLLLFGYSIAKEQPLNVNPAINPIFGETATYLGLILVAIAAMLAWQGGKIEKYIQDYPDSGSVLTPESLPRTIAIIIAILFSVLGFILVSFGIAIFRFDAVGGAPGWEPITGRLGHLPHIENTFFALMYTVPGIAFIALLRVILMKPRPLQRKLLATICVTLFASGVTFFAFGILNNYTHTGMMRNVCVNPGPEVPVESPECKEYRYYW